eukprot:3595474-Pyramimonas_sp.AAC.1
MQTKLRRGGWGDCASSGVGNSLQTELNCTTWTAPRTLSDASRIEGRPPTPPGIIVPTCSLSYGFIPYQRDPCYHPLICVK